MPAHPREHCNSTAFCRIRQRKEEIAGALERVRARTLWLLDQVPDEYLRRRVHSFYSPIGWHFGHVGRTEEFWVVNEALGGDPIDPQLSFLYADRADNPKNNRVNIPDRPGTIAYLKRTRDAALKALEVADLSDESDTFVADGYAWEFAIQHEYQHQETIAEMLTLIHQDQRPIEVDGFDWRPQVESHMIDVAGGDFLMGSDDPHGYDNEKRAHRETVAPFRISRTQVTAFEWGQFILDSGYERKEFWCSEGWQWVRGASVNKPEYWVGDKSQWSIYYPFGVRAIHPDEPASCISWFEACAFAEWAGKRLPTEVEWEFMARADGMGASRRFPWGSDAPDNTRARFQMAEFSPAPVGSHIGGSSACGAFDVAGNVWEWTSTTFHPYPGFKAFPYDGYSKDHMQGSHFSCRGGSWATSGPILRCSFRNWYVPSYRQGFLGLRLAEDVA